MSHLLSSFASLESKDVVAWAKFTPIILFYRKGNWDSKRKKGFLKVTQLLWPTIDPSVFSKK